MSAPSERRVTWAEVAEWLPDGEAEVAFDRDVAPTGMEATLCLRHVGELRYGPQREWEIAKRIAGPPARQLYELWVIDEEAPLIAHKHDVRVNDFSFPEPKEVAAGLASPPPCRCRVWRGVERRWCQPEDVTPVRLAERGTALYEVVGGRARLVR